MPWTPAHPTESVRGATKTTTTMIIVIISISRSYFCVVRTTHISFALAVKAISSFFFSSCRARFSSLSTFTRAWAPLTRFSRKLDCVLPEVTDCCKDLYSAKARVRRLFQQGCEHWRRNRGFCYWLVHFVCKLVPRVLSYSSTLSRSKGRVGEEPGNEVVLWAVYYCILLKRLKRIMNI